MKKVNVIAIAEELEALPDEWSAFWNKKTGEFRMISEESIVAYEDGVAEDEYLGDGDFETEMEFAAEICKDGSDYLLLPDKGEIGGYKLMEDFVYSISNEKSKEVLLKAIKGRGAFRNFRDQIDNLGLTEDWYKYKSDAYVQFVTDWAEVNHLEIE